MMMMMISSFQSRRPLSERLLKSLFSSSLCLHEVIGRDTFTLNTWSLNHHVNQWMYCYCFDWWLKRQSTASNVETTAISQGTAPRVVIPRFRSAGRIYLLQLWAKGTFCQRVPWNQEGRVSRWRLLWSGWQEVLQLWAVWTHFPRLQE